MKIFRLSISSSLVIFKLAKSPSYSAWLFKALKLNQRAYSVITPSKLVRMRSAPLPCALDAPSICSTHTDVNSNLGVAVYFILYIWPLAKVNGGVDAELLSRTTWASIALLTVVGFVIPGFMPSVFRPSYEGVSVCMCISPAVLLTQT